MVCCWWCCHEIEGEPLNIPYKYDHLRSKFSTTGYFCSWSCMKSYAIERYGDMKGSIMSGNIILMRKKMFNKIGPVKMAPHRFRLKMFGGDLTIEEFRKNVIVDKEVPSEINAEPLVEMVVPITSTTRKMSDINNASGSNEPLKLKRAAPLKRNQNNLESVLGLIIK